MTKHWPSTRLHIPTMQNSLADVGAAITRQLKDRKDDLERLPIDIDLGQYKLGVGS